MLPRSQATEKKVGGVAAVGELSGDIGRVVRTVGLEVWIIKGIVTSYLYFLFYLS